MCVHTCACIHVREAFREGERVRAFVIVHMCVRACVCVFMRTHASACVSKGRRA